MTQLPSKENLLAQFGGVPRVLERIVGGFLDGYSGHLQGIETALQSGDSELVARKSHSFKGSLGYFSQGSLYQLVVQMEDSAKLNQLSQAAELFPEVRNKSRVLYEHLASMIGR